MQLQRMGSSPSVAFETFEKSSPEFSLVASPECALRELDCSTESSNVSKSFMITFASEGDGLSELNSLRPELAHFKTSRDTFSERLLLTVLVNWKISSTSHARKLRISSEASRTDDNISMLERKEWHILSTKVNMSSSEILPPAVALPCDCKIK